MKKFGNLISIDLGNVQGYGESWKGCEFVFKPMKYESVIKMQEIEQRNQSEKKQESPSNSQEMIIEQKGEDAQSQSGNEQVSTEMLEYMGQLCREHFVEGEALNADGEKVNVSPEEYAEYFQDISLTMYVIETLTSNTNQENLGTTSATQSEAEKEAD